MKSRMRTRSSRPRFRKAALLAIDVGNSTASYGIFEGGVLRSKGYIENINIPQFSYKLINKWGNCKYFKVIISSAVPHLTKKLVHSLRRIVPRRSVYLVGQNIPLRVPMRYRKKVLGQDRLVNIYGALKRYKTPCLVIDFGTAITFDYISKSGIFEGGLIVPGIRLSLDALWEKTALLPRIRRLKHVRALIGRETKSAMLSGILNGFGALTDGLVKRFRERSSSKLTVVATGGYAAKIALYTTSFDYLDPLHTIRSLALIYEREIKDE